MASSSLDSASWHKIRIEELTRILEVCRTNGEKRLKELQERRAALKARQDILQQRRIARLKMEGVMIDLEALKRRCKASKDSLWYDEEVSDDEERKVIMRKRLKNTFKIQNSESIQELPDNGESNGASQNGEKDVKVENAKTQRGNLLRNYTNVFTSGQDKDSPVNRETKDQKDAANTSPKSPPVKNKGDLFKPKGSQNGEKKSGAQKLQKALNKITTASKMSSVTPNLGLSPRQGKT